MKKHIIVVVFLLISLSTISQVEKSSELYNILKTNDSLIFDSSFNTCNLKILSTLIHDDLEFYHDKAGLMEGKDAFLENTKNGLCKSSHKLRRELLEETLEVFPLNDSNGKLYGAIQKGTHRFYENEKRTSIALFTHLWILKNDKWLLKRVLSYNHKTEIN
ncbi:nuclear transport factor 2 family protein [Aureibaculum sp. 2210JD6-5]|uniref:nuclear transport factor 2 family protein n=1 Tax=Aureibaculum sp. 2210JD6-5 TaxID=3103957 RepID=UPI002AACED11|nr:nuclear transport factor 2 family protein [Aureibaculum sp. 2210JD6-5]MDY7396565.1 nuclear transport factor 2 family protein [Aureibaculum sp. 2210JD6-5]